MAIFDGFGKKAKKNNAQADKTNKAAKVTKADKQAQGRKGNKRQDRGGR